MSPIIDLTARGGGGGPYEPLRHPAGVSLPFDGPSDAALIIPEIRGEIRSGAYDADMIALLGEAVRPRDRVLVIGAGLGVLSTLIAKSEGVERVIALEANTALIPYLERTHALNGVEVETVNAVLAEGKKGRVPFFARRDIRASSLLPHDQSWQQVMMVPFMDLNLILEEERISLIVCEIPVGSAELLAQARLETVERILLDTSDDPDAAWADEGACARLVSRGYVPEAAGGAVLFRRADGLAAPVPREGEAAEPEAGEAAGPAEELLEEEEEEEETAPREVGEEAAADRAAEAVQVPPGRPTGEPPAAAGRPPRRRPPPGAEPSEKEEAEEAAMLRREAGEPNGGWAGLWRLVAVALFLALPLMLISELAAERGESRSAALEVIGASWGKPQALTGPYLLVPVEGPGGAAPPLVVLPERLEVASKLVSETREHNSFETQVYRSLSEARFIMAPASAAALIEPGETARWQEAVLGLGLSDPAALGEAEFLGPPGAGGFAPGSRVAGLRGIHAPVGDPRGGGAEWRLRLELAGSRALSLAPAGGTTLWRVAADWAHPAFSGPFPPALRTLGPEGFVAEWRVPRAAQEVPLAFRGTGPVETLRQSALGVRLAQAVDLYVAAERAAKFGLLFIVLAFGAIFLIERTTPRRAGVVDYLLIGAGQCTFFLLLMPLAERIGFPAAYALGAAATVALLTAYCWCGLRLGPRAGWVLLALAILYGLMYPILLAREHALLMGAVLAFLVVAALMWGARQRNGRGRGSAVR